MQLSDLGLPRKAYDALRACNVSKVEDILLLPKATLLARPRIGLLTIKKIEFALRRHGFEWIDKVADEPPLTLRDKFAMSALPALIARHRADIPWGDVAPRAYEIADAMVAERKR